MDRGNSPVNLAISLQNLTKIYNDQTVVDNVNIDLAEGEFLSLLGPSGSGKTTILRMIAGLVPLDKGKLILNGVESNDIPPNKRNLGMVFQQYALFPHMTVWENVAYGLRVKKMKGAALKERVERYLKLVGLEHLASRKPRELSGGQQQRVSLARAMAVEPVVLLFDEPLSNLDVRLKEQMVREIRNLHQTLGFTAVYVTHDQNEALYLSDKIAVLNKGRVEQVASPEEILSKPATPFVADFLGYTNRLEGAVLLDDHRARVGDIELPVGHVAADCQPGDSGQLLLRTNACQLVQPDSESNQSTSGVKKSNQVSAQVVECRYLGGQTELKLSLPAARNQEMTCLWPRMLKPLPAAGMKVDVWFDADNISFFHD